MVELIEVDRPVPGAGEVLVKVQAAGVNPIDWKIRDGAGQRLGMMLPIRLGREIAGMVAQVGPDVVGFAHGDAVYGVTYAGGFGEYAAAPAEGLARKPADQVALTIARQFLAHGHEATISGRGDAAALSEKISRLGAGATAASVREAATAEIVILTVPWQKVEGVLKGPRPGTAAS